MKKRYQFLFLTLTIIGLSSCARKTDQDRAIDLVKLKYENSDQKLNFKNSSLDSLYNIEPKAYADSIRKGNELDSVLAVLESEIEHLSQKESDSVGMISARLTKDRYRLLETAKVKPQFIGWKLTGVKPADTKSNELSFKFDKGITVIVP
ncbi:hypothetical protein GJU39_02970 [Pedobacter petrophilus]|uniref:Lipoprotein n=1 Tax=Pedobacter petrophilus TaxID=1908241 RepID=A0A7K0FTY7_9SPHI|nr:hypothetical protein [Pedobacter petrophilus]MRX75038.1 hypothetical protein [Pedobacter petrophilus]